LEQNTDIVIFIHRQDDGAVGDGDIPIPSSGKHAPYTRQMEIVVTEIIVTKHRHGPTGSVELIFFPSRTHF
jgi:replicative DNA helicase